MPVFHHQGFRVLLQIVANLGRRRGVTQKPDIFNHPVQIEARDIENAVPLTTTDIGAAAYGGLL